MTTRTDLPEFRRQTSLAITIQFAIIYGIDACNNAIEVAVGLQGLVAMPNGTTTLGIPDFLRYVDFKAETGFCAVDYNANIDWEHLRGYVW